MSVAASGNPHPLSQCAGRGENFKGNADITGLRTAFYRREGRAAFSHAVGTAQKLNYVDLSISTTVSVLPDLSRG